MFDLQRTFHFGMAVDDIEAARAQLGADMNLSWTATWLMDPLPFWTPEAGEHEIVLKACYSRTGPHHLELVESASPFYAPAAQPDSRHIGVWVDDLPVECERLLSAGWRVLASGASPDNGFGTLMYLLPPTGGWLVELVSAELMPVIEAWLQAPDDDSS